MSASESVQDPRQKKRPRATEEPHQSASGSAGGTLSLPAVAAAHSPERHEELWFEDGSVVLVAQNTGFRVFRSLLAEQSTVFSDMFSSSSPNGCSMLDECPVVQLSDSDAAEDAIDFLRVLFKPKYQQAFFSSSSSLCFLELSAVIRLALKYHVQAVLDRAIICLHDGLFTTDFDELETSALEDNGVIGFVYYAPSVVNLARLIERHSLLPIAFYHSAVLGTMVLDGYERRDHSVEHLSLEDIKRCIDGRSALVEKSVELLSKTEPCEGCVTRSICQSALQMMLELAVADDKASSPEVLTSWRNIIDRWAEEHDLCDLCTKAAIERDVMARKEVWYSLPKIFQIEVDGWVPSAS